MLVVVTQVGPMGSSKCLLPSHAMSSDQPLEFSSCSLPHHSLNFETVISHPAKKTSSAAENLEDILTEANREKHIPAPIVLHKAHGILGHCDFSLTCRCKTHVMLVTCKFICFRAEPSARGYVQIRGGASVPFDFYGLFPC